MHLLASSNAESSWGLPFHRMQVTWDPVLPPAYLQSQVCIHSALPHPGTLGAKYTLHRNPRRTLIAKFLSLGCRKPGELSEEKHGPYGEGSRGRNYYKVNKTPSPVSAGYRPLHEILLVL